MSLYHLFSQLVKKHLFLSILVIFISVLVILGAVGLFSVSAYIIAFCGLTPSIAEIMVPVVGVRFFGISRGLLRYAERLVSHSTTFRLLSELRNWLYEQISSTKSSEMLLLDKEDAFTRLVDDIERLQEFYLRTFNPYITSIFIGLIGIFGLILLRPELGISFAFFYGLAIIVLPMIIGMSTKKLFHEHISAIGISKVQLLDMISGLAELITAGALQRYRSKLEAQWKQIYRIELRLGLWKSLSSAVINLLMNLGILGAVCIAGLLLSQGKYEAVMVPVVAYAVFALFEGAQPVAVVLQKIEESRVSAKRIEELSLRCGGQREEKIGIATSSIEEGIVVENIAFKYKGMDTNALEKISLKLTPGKRIALVGSSGAGKTTLSNVLLGWLPPTEGVVHYEADPETLFSVVNQKVYFFNTSIRNNLKIANIEATEEEIREVLRNVELSELINSLPNGLDTELGEGDLKLSGGQRQRLAIARAILRRAPYLLFDEITAGLDAQTESKVVETLLSVTKMCGIVVLTHRLVHMELYDEILVMDQGRIIERGSHDELMEYKGMYEKMVSIQQSYLTLASKDV